MHGRYVYRLSFGLTRIFAAYSSFSCTSMSRLRYFANPYREENGDEAGNAKKTANPDLAGVRDDLFRIIRDIVKNAPPDRTSSDGGLYVGSAGIAYALLHVSSCLKTLPFRNDDEMNVENLTSLAQRYLKSSLRDLEKRGNRVDCGFLLGDGGTIAIAAVIADTIGDTEKSQALIKRYVGMGEFCKPENYLQTGSDEFFVGRAGYLYGSLWLNRKLGKNAVPLELMHEIARVIVHSGDKYSRRHASPCPLMYAYYGTEYLGAAHGLSSILQVLIQVPEFLSTNEKAEQMIRTSVDFLLSMETPSGNYPCALDEIDSNGCSTRGDTNELVHWCHGSPGVIYLMAAAYLRWKDSRYLKACIRAGELVWHKGLLKKGPGICHGIAGSGYVFLLLNRLTSEPHYLARARDFANFLKTDDFKRGARTPDCLYSLYEGTAGTACFLADLLVPDQAAFPFQNVF